MAKPPRPTTTSNGWSHQLSLRNVLNWSKVNARSATTVFLLLLILDSRLLSILIKTDGTSVSSNYPLSLSASSTQGRNAISRRGARRYRPRELALIAFVAACPEPQYRQDEPVRLFSKPDFCADAAVVPELRSRRLSIFL